MSFPGQEEFMPMNPDIAVNRNKDRSRRQLHPELRTTMGTRAEHLKWAAYLAVRAITGVFRIIRIATYGVLQFVGGVSSPEPGRFESSLDRPRHPGTIPADLVVRFLEGRFAERQPDLRSGFEFHSRWIGCTARGSLSERHNMIWSPEPLPGDPEAHEMELNHTGDAATIHIRNIWRSGLIIRSRYGTAWFALALSSKQLAFRSALAIAAIAAVTYAVIA
jgi:hypothetical protein